MNILAIDQAASSGWALWIGSRPAKYGTAKATQRQGVIELVSSMTSMRCVVIFEDHTQIRIAGRRKAGSSERVYDTSAATIHALGRAQGWWQALLSLAGHDDRATVLCPIGAWKKACGAGGGAGREDAIRAAERHAYALGAVASTPDEAVATCIAHWATLAPEARQAWDRVFAKR